MNRFTLATFAGMFIRRRRNKSGTVSVVVVDKIRELKTIGVSSDPRELTELEILVSEDGYPLSYSIFNGSQYEGRTMIPIIDDFVQRFGLEDFVVVADSGLMSAKNVALLESAGYKYIIGARIKSESPELRAWIMSIEWTDGAIAECRRAGAQRLIVGYSEARARKNAWDRDKGVEANARNRHEHER